MWIEFLTPIILFVVICILETIFDHLKYKKMAPIYARQKLLVSLKKKEKSLNTMGIISYLMNFS
jgi:hypothetical protein